MDMKNFNPDSMERALLHHVKEGRLVEYQRVDANGARARWYVTGNAGIHAQSETMSDRECAALCFGLASAQFGERADDYDDDRYQLADTEVGRRVLGQ